MRGGERVKPEYVLVAVVTACLTAISGTPALAAPRQIEEFCFDKHGDTSRGILTGEVHGKRLLLTA